MSACRTFWPASAWWPSCCRTRPRRRRSPRRCSRCCAIRRRKSGKSSASTIFIICCARTRPKKPPTRSSRSWIMAVLRRVVCGVDEAGRGPLAGPVYAPAVILNPARRINGLADSKILAPERREVLAGRIRERAIAWAVARASVEDIDQFNIFRASLLAMRRATVDGDALHPVISAASILAKTERDAEMARLHEQFPQYGFDRHKGYSTPEHLEALARLGPCDIHRRSFEPVRIFFQKNLI